MIFPLGCVRRPPASRVPSTYSSFRIPSFSKIVGAQYSHSSTLFKRSSSQSYGVTGHSRIPPVFQATRMCHNGKSQEIKASRTASTVRPRSVAQSVNVRLTPKYGQAKDTAQAKRTEPTRPGQASANTTKTTSPTPSSSTSLASVAPIHIQVQGNLPQCPIDVTVELDSKIGQKVARVSAGHTTVEIPITLGDTVDVRGPGLGFVLTEGKVQLDNTPEIRPGQGCGRVEEVEVHVEGGGQPGTLWVHRWENGSGIATVRVRDVVVRYPIADTDVVCVEGGSNKHSVSEGIYDLASIATEPPSICITNSAQFAPESASVPPRYGVLGDHGSHTAALLAVAVAAAACVGWGFYQLTPDEQPSSPDQTTTTTPPPVSDSEPPTSPIDPTSDTQTVSSTPPPPPPPPPAQTPTPPSPENEPSPPEPPSPQSLPSTPTNTNTTIAATTTSTDTYTAHAQRRNTDVGSQGERTWAGVNFENATVEECVRLQEQLRESERRRLQRVDGLSWALLSVAAAIWMLTMSGYRPF